MPQQVFMGWLLIKHWGDLLRDGNQHIYHVLIFMQHGSSPMAYLCLCDSVSYHNKQQCFPKYNLCP
jgi:hypothetical protein